MRAVVLDSELQYISNYPKPVIEQGWAIIKVIKAGICNTDLELIKGYMGFKGVLGHEFVGIVKECEDKTWIDKIVTGEINFGCNTCDSCLKGLQRHCPNRSTLGIVNADGCMSDYCKIPIDCLVEIPQDITINKAIFIEPLSAACEILEQLNILQPIHFSKCDLPTQPQNGHIKFRKQKYLRNNYTGTEQVTVLGDGKLGILCAWVLSTVFENVTLVGHHKEKLLIASWNEVKTIENSDNLPKADIVVEATGSVNGLNSAVELCIPRGTIILKSTIAEQTPVNFTQIVVDEITVIGSRCGQFKDGLNILQNYPDLPLERLISSEFPAEKSIEAFSESSKKGILKVLINFGDWRLEAGD